MVSVFWTALAALRTTTSDWRTLHPSVARAFATTATPVSPPRPQRRRPLPDDQSLVIGYTSQLEKVPTAVRDGVNVVVWAFADIVAVTAADSGTEEEEATSVTTTTPATTTTTAATAATATPRPGSTNDRPWPTQVVTHLNLTAVQACIHDLDRHGASHVVHLISFGGWNGPHLDERLSAQDWYHHGFRSSQLGQVFHGLDWDLEGHDDLTRSTNEFTRDCLDKMVAISRMAHDDGYIVGMAPPQSYLDVDHDRFSRRVNGTDVLPRPHDWHADFPYFGQNVYAYLLAQGADEAIDFISIQFYESYARAAMYVALQQRQQEEDSAWRTRGAAARAATAATDYLVHYVQRLAAQNWTHRVDFSSDPQLLDLPPFIQEVPIPLHKLVWGLANGWALSDPEKVFFASPESVRRAWDRLAAQDLLPRGVMFWTLDEEGSHGVQFAKGIASFVHARKDCAADY